jgi:syntaxin-binding protein 1
MLTPEQIAGVCIALGEYPKVRYYRPKNPIHEASVLCSHLARFVQEELDEYGRWNPNFPPPTSRAQGYLMITDRSMDLVAPLVHEFTYQAMAHDLLSIRDAEKVTYHMTVNEGSAGAEEKDMELSDKDEVWVKNRHRHMKDTIDKLMADFQGFLKQNPNFTDDNQDTTSLNAIRDMLAGLPQFQEMKEAYSLHLTMAQESMNMFEKQKLPDVASIEQTLATGLDEDYKKPKNVLDQVVRLLDDEAIPPTDRLRLIMLYILFRDGVIPEDIKRLLAHSSLPPSDGEVITNLELLGAQPTHPLKEVRPPPPPLFPRNPKAATQGEEEFALSRFRPALKTMLEELCKGTLDQTAFPYTKPPMEPDAASLATQGSLRAAKPGWALAGRREAENRQRMIVFVAGGATYSEARSCYEVSRDHRKDVFLVSSHMLTPTMFLRQVGDLSVDKRRLDLPMERPKPKAPAHLFERPAPPASAPGVGRAPVPGMGPGVGVGGQRMAQRIPPGGAAGIPPRPQPPTQQMANLSVQNAPMNGGGGGNEWPGSADVSPSGSRPAKLEKEKEHKKKRHFLGLKK